jgi:hypothetical protein
MRSLRLLEKGKLEAEADIMLSLKHNYMDSEMNWHMLTLSQLYGQRNELAYAW